MPITKTTGDFTRDSTILLPLHIAVVYYRRRGGNFLVGYCCKKGKGPVLDTALLYVERTLMSALQSRKWQLIGMS